MYVYVIGRNLCLYIVGKYNFCKGTFLYYRMLSIYSQLYLKNMYVVLCKINDFRLYLSIRDMI